MTKVLGKSRHAYSWEIPFVKYLLAEVHPGSTTILSVMKVEFVKGGKPEYMEKKLRSQIEIDKCQLTCGTWESIHCRRGGKRD